MRGGGGDGHIWGVRSGDAGVGVGSWNGMLVLQDALVHYPGFCYSCISPLTFELKHWTFSFGNIRERRIHNVLF